MHGNIEHEVWGVTDKANAGRWYHKISKYLQYTVDRQFRQIVYGASGKLICCCCQNLKIWRANQTSGEIVRCLTQFQSQVALQQQHFEAINQNDGGTRITLCHYENHS